jgi:hypothetical protein
MTLCLLPEPKWLLPARIVSALITDLTGFLGCGAVKTP